MSSYLNQASSRSAVSTKVVMDVRGQAYNIITPDDVIVRITKCIDSVYMIFKCILFPSYTHSSYS